VGSLDRRRNQWYSRLQRDARGARTRARLDPLHEPLPAPRPLREHRDRVALACEPDGSLDRLDVALAAPHRERAAGVEEVAERPPVELRLRHEAEEPARPEGHPERPRVEVREVVRSEHEPALFREILGSAGAQPIEASDDGPRKNRDDAVGRARAHPPYSTV